MVTDDVWAASGLGTHDGCPCLGCLETRLDRTLTPADFLACPLNLGIFEQSDRLVDRLGDTSWMVPVIEAHFAAR